MGIEELSKSGQCLSTSEKVLRKITWHGLSLYLPFLFESKYIRTKGILKCNGKALEGISSDQKGGLGIPLLLIIKG
jgi:hypothetical protein